MRAMAIATCTVCGKNFLCLQAEVNRGKGRCCSIHCRQVLAGKGNHRGRVGGGKSGTENSNWKGGINKNKSCLYRERYPERREANLQVHRVIVNGNLVQGHCEVCGSAKTHAHHEDYNKPFEIVWLCPKHHRIRHGALAKQVKVKFLGLSPEKGELI